ncbi:hypothetical protein, partial [Burkholderia vietnamiensis]|uniref:hypothetical protein n=1 Tax=Burkholderia vietnamiensis TaxID=60552 RepID=UPI001CF4AA7A
MGRKPLPDIVSPSSAELRALWSRFRADREVRRLIIEIVRVRRLVADVEAHRKSIAKAWTSDEVKLLLARRSRSMRNVVGRPQMNKIRFSNFGKKSRKSRYG